MKQIKIRDKTYTVNEASEEAMMQQLRDQGAEIIAACGGAGICTTCCFKPIVGEFTDKTETENLMDLPDGQRLSCQCWPKTDGEIELTY